MNAQNRNPITASSATRTPRPFLSLTDRARAVSIFGTSSCSSFGFGSSAAPSAVCRPPSKPPSAACSLPSTSGIQNLNEIPRRKLTREPHEDLLQSAALLLRARAQFVHRAARDDLPARNNRDAIAQRLGRIQRVRAHENRVPATHVLLE